MNICTFENDKIWALMHWNCCWKIFTGNSNNRAFICITRHYLYQLFRFVVKTCRLRLVSQECMKYDSPLEGFILRFFQRLNGVDNGHM